MLLGQQLFGIIATIDDVYAFVNLKLMLASYSGLVSHPLG